MPGGGFQNAKPLPRTSKYKSRGFPDYLPSTILNVPWEFSGRRPRLRARSGAVAPRERQRTFGSPKVRWDVASGQPERAWPEDLHPRAATLEVTKIDVCCPWRNLRAVPPPGASDGVRHGLEDSLGPRTFETSADGVCGGWLPVRPGALGRPTTGSRRTRQGRGDRSPPPSRARQMLLGLRQLSADRVGRVNARGAGRRAACGAGVVVPSARPRPRGSTGRCSDARLSYARAPRRDDGPGQGEDLPRPGRSLRRPGFASYGAEARVTTVPSVGPRLADLRPPHA